MLRKFRLLKAAPRKNTFAILGPSNANSNSALVPEIWAAEALMRLDNTWVMPQLVHRDFSNEIASFGDTVNANRPQNFEFDRHHVGDDITIQDAESVKVPVVLNQLPDISFIIYDSEMSLSFENLITKYLDPAIAAMAQGIDRILLGQMYQYMANPVGKLGTDPTRTTLLQAQALMSNNKVPTAGRNLVISPNMSQALMDNIEFMGANQVGDDGSAMREGHLGRKAGFDTFVTQNAPSIAVGQTIVTGAINNGAGYAVGDTALTVDGMAAEASADQVGAWCTIAGDMRPRKITAAAGGAATTSITIDPALDFAVVDDAVLTIYVPQAVNLAAGYAANWSKKIIYDTFGAGLGPKPGQLISFGDAGTLAKYSGMDGMTITTGLLDRPLDVAIADGDNMGIGPAGEFAFAFHRNALALVSRPLERPTAGNVSSAVLNANGVAIRVVISYDHRKKGTLVSIDCLLGVKVLDSALGAVMYA